jgi:hypothetical protein
MYESESSSGQFTSVSAVTLVHDEQTPSVALVSHTQEEFGGHVHILAVGLSKIALIMAAWMLALRLTSVLAKFIPSSEYVNDATLNEDAAI